jgi:hypothetical protein
MFASEIYRKIHYKENDDDRENDKYHGSGGDNDIDRVGYGITD